MKSPTWFQAIQSAARQVTQDEVLLLDSIEIFWNIDFSNTQLCSKSPPECSFLPPLSIQRHLFSQYLPSFLKNDHNPPLSKTKCKLSCPCLTVKFPYQVFLGNYIKTYSISVYFGLLSITNSSTPFNMISETTPN